MNPRVKDPALVGRLQPTPPSPIGGIDWTTVGITLLGLAGPVGIAVSGLLSQLRNSKTANVEMAQGIQAVKDRLFPKHEDGSNPQMRDEVNKILENHQKKSKKTVQKIIAKK
jgi:hypothetical protein